MRVAAALLILVWAAINLGASFFMVTSAFLAKTPAKEGLPAQAALLLGGLAIGAISLALIGQCLRTARG